MKKAFLEILLTIDPSTSATGWALTELRNNKKPRLLEFCETFQSPQGLPALRDIPTCGVIVPVGNDWVLRCINIRDHLQIIVREFHPSRILCEIPETWKSMTGRAASLSGSTLKLGFCSGCLAGISPNVATQFISANEWKGQTPKSLTRERVKEFFGHDEPNEHICDALGIARWFYKAKKEERLK